MAARGGLIPYVVGAFAILAMAPVNPAIAAPHIRGTVSAMKDGVLSVQTTGGAEDIKTPAGMPVFLVTKTDLSAVTANKFIGVASEEKDGKRVAKEVTVFADGLRGVGEGHYPWDLGSRSSMTNGSIATVNAVGADRELKVNYKGGEQTIAVPENAPVVALDKGGPDQLVAGRKVFVVLKDGAKEAVVVIVGAEGVTPPM